jgi:peptidoglycan/xylan/chitin deacetylase (PgdA/CDA1 family)
VEEMGWNQYGGWRLGIRSLDSKRYYYYAHLRKDRPYSVNVERGKQVQAGDVIGYVGRTGYSSIENTNNIKQSHLHWGLQIIFDGSQKIGIHEIWVDVYQITKLLQKHKSETVRDPETKEYTRKQAFEEPARSASSLTNLNDDVLDDLVKEVPIIMYHSITKNTRGSAYIITPAELESDLKYLRDNGYDTVTVDDLVAYVKGKAPLPKKPIVLSFDDGHYNNIYYGEPLLKKYGMRGVIAIVGAFSDKTEKEGVLNEKYSYVTWDLMKEVQASGVFEIQSHSYDLHSATDRRKGCGKRSGESLEDYRRIVVDDLSRLQEKVFSYTGRYPNAFIYPFGNFNKDLDAIIREMGFACTFTCSEGVSVVAKGDPSSLFGLKRKLRSSGTSVQNMMEKY